MFVVVGLVFAFWDVPSKHLSLYRWIRNRPPVCRMSRLLEIRLRNVIYSIYGDDGIGNAKANSRKKGKISR